MTGPEPLARTPAAQGDLESAVSEADRLVLRVWVRLLACTQIGTREIRRRLRAHFGTTLPRFDVLAQLDRAREGLTMGELSGRLMVTNGNITGLVARLADEGLVTREPAPGDRRRQLVRLTSAGVQHFREMVPANEAWTEQLFGAMSRSDLAALHDLLGTLKLSLQNQPAGRHLA